MFEAELKSAQMRKKRGHFCFGIIAVLSVIIMAVAFFVPCPIVVILSSLSFVVSSVLHVRHFINTLDKANSSPFDDFGYC